jgi:hypothetical protein
MLGKDLSPYERKISRSPFGPSAFSEQTCRLALEHALKLRGRGCTFPLFQYLHLHLAAYTACGQKRNQENL